MMLRSLVAAGVLVGLTACGEERGPTTPSGPNANGPVAFSVSGSNDSDDSDGGRRPQADNLEASVVFTRLRGRSRTCQGEDGQYFENEFTLTGTSTGDARVSGRIEVRLHDLFNATELLGPQPGKVIIRDATTGRKKAEGEYHSWGPADFIQATIVGRVLDEGVGAEPTRGAGRLAANWRIIYRPNGSVLAQIGGLATDNRLPAGVSSGDCSGSKWTPVDIELPAPTASTAAGVERVRGIPRP